MTTAPSIAPATAAPLEAPLAAFERFEKRHETGCPSWLRALRTSGISHFAEMGFPTSDQELWRFTNPAALAAFPFVTVPDSKPVNWSGQDLAGFGFEGLEAHRLVFLDGHFVPALSQVLDHPEGLVIDSLARAIQTRPDLVENSLGRVARHETDSLAALNTAFMQDGAFVYIPPGQELAAPIHLLFIATQGGTVNQPRNLFVARAQSRVRIIEDYLSATDAACWTNAVTEILAGGQARLEHVKLQRENAASLHVATVEARQHRDSRVLSHSISLGARLARNNIHLRFEAAGCDSILNGLYFATGDQLVDHHTIADHAQPHCSSHEFYHGILAGRARGVFNGRIFVRQDAQKTDAKQTNRNLLLSSEATINAKPQLEILADDVKCTHGATVGQLDEEAVFYLRSRGLGETQARRMLIEAFAGQILNRIEIGAVRQALEQWLGARLTRALEDAGRNLRTE